MPESFAQCFPTDSLVFANNGVDVPGQFPLERELERDGLSWVRAALEAGTVVDTIVIDGILKKGTSLVARAAGSTSPPSAA